LAKLKLSKSALQQERTQLKLYERTLPSLDLKRRQLTVELAHVDGGGEGVLPTLTALLTRYARRHDCSQIQWLVHAVHCARPNLELRRVLERRGFEVERTPEQVEVYRLVEPVSD